MKRMNCGLGIELLFVTTREGCHIPQNSLARAMRRLCTSAVGPYLGSSDRATTSKLCVEVQTLQVTDEALGN